MSNTIDRYFNRKKRKRREVEIVSNPLTKPKKKKQNSSLWNSENVKLPHHPMNVFFRSGKELSKWFLIKTVLSNFVAKNVQDLVNMIIKINPESKDRNFYNLVNFFQNVLKQKDKEIFFGKILPKIQVAVIDLEVYFGDRSIPVLLQRIPKEVVLNRREIACLLSCAFLCIIPNQRNDRMPSTINFLRLYTKCRPPHIVFEKLKTLMNYFFQFWGGEEPIPGSVSFRRCVFGDRQNWKLFRSQISYEVKVFERGCIEDYHPYSSSHVDFANRYIGGGVLGNGCVQEEILFLIHPELIVSRLLTEKLRNNECLVAGGQHKYSGYEGYAKTYRFKESRSGGIGRRRRRRKTKVSDEDDDDDDEEEEDDDDDDDYSIFDIGGDFIASQSDEGALDPRIRRTNLICLDAVDFKNYRDSFKVQFKKMMIRRELDKCFLGFQNASYKEIVTGNWGCGAFAGNHQLKALIQIISAAACEKSLVYFTFAAPTLSSDRLREFVHFINDNKVSVSQNFDYMTRFYEERNQNEDLFGFIQRKMCERIISQQNHQKSVGGINKNDDDDDNNNNIKKIINNTVLSENEYDELSDL